MPSRVAAIAEATPSSASAGPGDRVAGRGVGRRAAALAGPASAVRAAVRVRRPGPWRARRRPWLIASRSSPSQSSSCWPTSRTHQASASDRDRATPASTRVSSTCRCGCRSRVITGAATCVNSSVAVADPDLPGHLAVEPALGLPGDRRSAAAGVLPERLGAAGACLVGLGRRGRLSGRSTSARVSRTMISSRSTDTSTGCVLPLLGDPAGEPAAHPLLRFVRNHVIIITPLRKTRSGRVGSLTAMDVRSPPRARSGPSPPCRSAGWRTPTTAPARRTPPRPPPGSPALDHAPTSSSSAPAPASSPSELRRARGTGCSPPTRSTRCCGTWSARLPGTPAAIAAAERIPLRARSVDTVVGAQAFHWWDLERALPEIARVLRPGGHLALVWNLRDERIPWVRRLGELIGTQEQRQRPDARAARLEPVRLRGDRDLPLLAAARPAAAARPGAVPVQHRDDERGRAGAGAAQGRRAVRRLRPRRRRDAAALRHALLQGRRRARRAAATTGRPDGPTGPATTAATPTRC